MAQVIFIVCPFCARSRVLEPKGSGALMAGTPKAKALLQAFGPKGRIRFDRLDPATDPFVQLREVPGGRGGGSSVVEVFTLAQAHQGAEVEDLIAQLKAQAAKLQAVLKALEGQG